MIFYKYPKINEKYSNDISEIVKFLFKLNPKERPSCNEILNISKVKSRIEFFNSGKLKNNIISENNNSLLKTIRLPKNINFLTEKLPKANYDIITEQSLSTVETSNLSRKIPNKKLILPILNAQNT